jgi:flagellar protein FlaG
MAANVDKIASVALSLNQSPKQQTDAEPKEKPAPPPPDAPVIGDYRLVIEEDPAARTFVYKTIDRATGQVVSQIPREQLLKLKEDPLYTAGDVLKTKA